MKTVKKNITLPITVYNTIKDYTKKSGMSFSDFLIETTLKTIIESEKLSLLEYINFNCSYVDKTEQKEIEDLNIDFDSIEGKEITRIL